MKELIEKILAEYSRAYKKNDKTSSVVDLVSKDLKNVIFNIVKENDGYLVKGSTGVGRMAAIPWVAIFNPLITSTAQSGYYPVYLFRDDMSGLYLSLNQGITEKEKDFGRKEGLEVLKVEAKKFRSLIEKIPRGFNANNIILKTLDSTTPKLSVAYESGNIISKFYSVKNIPSSLELQQDLLSLIEIYKILPYKINKSLPSIVNGDDEDEFSGYEDRTKVRKHLRIERNRGLSKKVKQAQGYTCKACELRFTDMYGVIGKEFIEAHHLIPFSQLGQEKVKLDAKEDFAVLCANCHRMIHKLKDPSNLELLKKIIKENRR